MEAWQEHLLDLWQTNLDAIAQTVCDAMARNPHLPVKYTREDLFQMFEGHLAMMNERFGGSSTEIWDTYVEVVYPGIFEQGQSITAMAGQVVMNAVLLQRLLVPLAREEFRDEIAEFLLRWYVELSMEIVKAGLKSGVTR